VNAAAADEERLLVLGATGNVGRHVIARLVFLAGAGRTSQRVRILAATRQPGAYSCDPPPEGCPAVVEPVACGASAGEVAACVAAARPTRIFLCMPQALSADEMRAYSEAVVDAAVACGVAWLVRLSSCGIDRAPSQGPLGDAHLAGEEYCRKAGMGLTSVRPTSFHTNFEKYDVGSIAAESVFRSPLGLTAKVNWVHCRDIGYVVAALLASPISPEALAARFEVVEVTGPASSTLSAGEMAAMLSEELGRPVRYEEVPAPPFPEYEALWTFLKAGGFDHSSDAVARLTGEEPLGMREVVRALRAELQPST